MTRLAVAVRPPEAVLDLLRALPRPPFPGVVWAPPERWIVKVRPLGHVALDLAEPLLESLVTALDGAPAAECVLGPATRRPGGQWLAVPVTGLEEIAAAVFEATEPIVPVTHPQPFRAYVPLASGRVPAELAGEPVEARWRAERVLLLADRSAPARARLDTLGEVPLGAA